MKEKESKQIEVARFALAVLIVARHSCELSVPNGGGYNTVIQVFISLGLGSLAVPVFFFVSGFLFFQHLEDWNWSVWKNKMKRRFGTLVIPYLCWNLFAVLFVFATMYLSGHSLSEVWQSLASKGYLRIFWDCNHVNATNSINAFGCPVPGGTPLDGPLWFLRDLIVLSCISPLIYWLCKHLKLIWLIITCVLYLLRIGIPVEGFSGDGIFFFSLGTFITVCEIDIFSYFERHKKTIIAAGSLLLIGLCFSYFYDKEVFRIIRYTFTVFGVGFVFLVLKPVSGKYSIEQIKKLSQTSFFIFALHGLILYPCVKYPISRLIVGDSEIFILLRYFCTILLTLAICLGCFFLCKKIAPRFLRYITGR